MRERVGRIIGEAVEGMPWLGTFHSVGANMLRRHAELAGLQSNFTILDTDDELRVLKQLIQATGLDEKRWHARQPGGVVHRGETQGPATAVLASGDANPYADGRDAGTYSEKSETSEEQSRGE